MKKTSTVILAMAVLSLSLFKTTAVQAQKGGDAPPSVITAGVGWSLVGALFGVLNNSVPDSSSVDLRQTPVIIGSYDYYISPKFSIGAAYSYQSFTFEYSKYPVTNSLGVTYYATYKDVLKRMNFAVRPLFHFGSSDEIDPYFGLRLGYTQWSSTTTNPDPYYNSLDFTTGSVGSPIKVQVLFGTRYWVADFLGLNAEVAIGSPYLAMLGANFRF